MLNDVYNRRILELAGTIPRIGRLDRPDASATAHSKLCGSTVSVDLKMDGDTVSDFAHEVKACALGQASSSIMARNVVGAKAGELRNLREAVRRMLKENGAPPTEGKWADIAVLEPVRDYKARHASTMLTFDAVVDTINQIEAKRATPGKVESGFPSGAATKTDAAPGKVGTGFPSGAATKTEAAGSSGSPSAASNLKAAE
jgi:NifU-like protein involved in Fe-S cluster formation